MSEEKSFELNNEIWCWYEDNEPIFLKAINKGVDPVELNCTQAKLLIQALTKFVNQIEQQDLEADLKRGS